MINIIRHVNDIGLSTNSEGYICQHFEGYICHPSITRLAHFDLTHFVKIINLPYFIEDVKRVCKLYSMC